MAPDLLRPDSSGILLPANSVVDHAVVESASGEVISDRIDGFDDVAQPSRVLAAQSSTASARTSSRSVSRNDAGVPTSRPRLRRFVTSTHLRPRAETDLVERTRYYRREGGDELGRRFFDEAVAALDSIARMPAAGTPRVGERCQIPGLRYHRVTGFPCGWFYFLADDGDDVVRLLTDAQDLPAILGDTERE